MRDKFVFADGQTSTNTDSTGEIMTNYFDLEQYANTDLMQCGVLNVLLTSVTVTSGLTEGMIFGVRLDDATDLATSQDGSSAGFTEIAMRHACTEALVAGRVITIPFHFDNVPRAKYLGGWVKAYSTQLTGNIVFDAWFSTYAESNYGIQKKPS